MSELKWHGDEAEKLILEVAMEALRTGAEAILTEAIDKAPVDTGTLRRSGTVTVGKLPDSARIYEAAESGNEMKDAFPDPIGEEKAVYISFNTPYARRMHEDLGYTPKRGGGPKYLESPFNRNKNKVLKMADLQIKKVLDRKE
jgi:hypothetical protein